MRVTGLVAELVMPAVRCDPLDKPALDRKRAGDCEYDAQWPGCLERPVREVPVKANSYSVPGDQVERGTDHGVGPGQLVSPRPAGGEHDHRERSGDQHDGERMLDAAGGGAG